MTCSKKVALVGGVAALLGAALPSPPVAAQAETRARAFMREVIGFAAADFASVDSGAIVTRRLETDDKAEVATFGATWVNATPDAFFEKARDVASFRQVPEILQIGVFSDPPVIGDLAGLTIPEDDVAEFRKCKPGKCDVKLGSAFIESVGRGIDWSSPGADDQAIGRAKQAMLDYLKAYQAGGTAAMGTVADKKDPKSRVDEFNAVLTHSRYILDYAPELFSELRDYPKGRSSEFRDVFYWTKDSFGLKPVISMYHVTVLRRGDRAVLAQKTLYASHYFNAGLELWSLAPPPSGKGFDMLMLYRTRLDPPTGMLAGVLLGKVKGGIETGVRENLANAKAKTEGS